MAGVLPTHRPSWQMARELRQACSPLVDPHPQELLTLKRWNEGNVAHSSPKSSLEDAGQNRHHSTPLHPPTLLPARWSGCSQGVGALDCPSCLLQPAHHTRLPHLPGLA